MNTVTHPVSPEEVMALLDGELSASEARAVSAHLDDCTECSELAEQFRSTSESLSHWNVTPISPALEEPILELAATQASSKKSYRPPSFWSWKQWAVGFGGIAVLLFVLISLATYKSRRAPLLTDEPFRQYQRIAAPSVQKPGLSLDRSVVPALPQRQMSNDQLEALMDAAPRIQTRELLSAADGLAATEPSGADVHNNSSSSFAPMIARTVSLILKVKDVIVSRGSLDRVLARHHGYFAQMSLNTQSGASRNFQASLRIPAPELTSTVDDLRTLGIVESESQSGEDVTQQHADLAARLKNNRETEDRLRAILQQRAGSVKDVLQVEEEIARVRGEIERMEAERTSLEHRVDYASVDLQLTEEYVAQLSPPADSVSARMRNALVAGYRHASETLLGLILFLMEYAPPLLVWLLILGLPIAAVWRYRRRNS